MNNNNNGKKTSRINNGPNLFLFLSGSTNVNKQRDMWILSSSITTITSTTSMRVTRLLFKLVSVRRNNNNNNDNNNNDWVLHAKL